MEDPEPPRGNPFERWQPKRVDIDLGEIIRIARELEPILVKEWQESRKAWNSSDIRKKIEDEHHSLDFTIVAQVAVTKGKKPVIAFGNVEGVVSEGSEPLSIMYNINPYKMSPNSDSVYIAEIEIPDQGQKVTARVISLNFKPPSSNHVVISEGLREKLGINHDDKIRITSIYQELSTLDLDRALEG